MSEELCGKPAVARYVWPSMQVINCCEEHAAKARAVANAMGFRLGELEGEDDDKCTQKVNKQA